LRIQIADSGMRIRIARRGCSETAIRILQSEILRRGAT
jgi:hypothetical protein